jgi:hypothetical protein
VNNLGDTRVGDSLTGAGIYKSQDFSVNSGYGGPISSVILSLNFTTTAVSDHYLVNVLLYNATANGPVL